MSSTETMTRYQMSDAEVAECHADTVIEWYQKAYNLGSAGEHYHVSWWIGNGDDLLSRTDETLLSTETMRRILASRRMAVNIAKQQPATNP